ncbi:MAG TPA: endonuclease/exonuclease/phosphatase family protein [Bacteroidia bacterium]|nr:endonuclease/exonuclease/phosphatase family protein [Bacteroidia bacterium]
MTEETPPIEPVPSRKKLSWLSRIVLFFNWFAIIGLLLGVLSPVVNPSRLWPLAFFGLVEPAFVLLNILFLLYWLLRRKRQGYYTLAALLISMVHFNRQYQVSFGTQDPAPAGSIKLMSWNVKLFDLYNWSGNKETRSKMFGVISAEAPDILCLQEFFTEDTGTFRNLDTIRSLMHLPYANAAYTITLRKTDHWGVATFSKYPIVDEGKIVFNNRSNNICLYSDIVKGKDTIRVYNMHLQSINFGYADIRFVETMLSEEDAENEIENSKNILRRMKRAYTRRAGQANAIVEHMQQCKYPMIICGDFNDTPVSYTYNILSSGMKDAFRESGSGFGKTFVNPLPIPRIDYILHSETMSSWEFRTIRTDGMSDHYPIVCKIRKE